MHVPVLREDVQKYLSLTEGEVVVDGTLGLGGHSSDLVQAVGKTGRLLAFDQDKRNLDKAKERLKDYEDQITFFHDNFCYLKTRVTGSGIDEVDGILLDLGLSSPHVDDAERGFSFSKEGPLDMRFDQRGKLSAYDVVNAYKEEDLIRIFFEYGEEKFSRKVAGLICERRKEKPFETTTELADFIEKIYPKKRSSKGSKSHPATKIFQALRIEVNDEMSVLRDVLEQASELLNVGGRIVIISYHSLEDRLVKQFFKKLMSPPPTPEQAIYQSVGDPFVEALTKKPVVPSDEEILENPRSRSAKLRAYKKIKQISLN